MQSQTTSDTPESSSRAIRPRFGLKLLFVLITLVSIGTAWLLQPLILTSVTVDLTQFDAYQKANTPVAPAGVIMSTPFEDHSIRIRTPRIISDTLKSSPQLKAFAENKSEEPIMWIYDRTEVIPAEGGKLRINVVGDGADKQELQQLAESLADTYLNFLRASYSDAGEITERNTSWTVRRR